jgi:hypothetical protein
MIWYHPLDTVVEPREVDMACSSLIPHACVGEALDAVTRIPYTVIGENLMLVKVLGAGVLCTGTISVQTPLKFKYWRV